MFLEAVWLKDGKEIACMYPAQHISYSIGGDFTIDSIIVHNGYRWYSCDKLTKEEPDDFIVRVKR